LIRMGINDQKSLNKNSLSLGTCIHIENLADINTDIRKHRMTYERAGEYFRAMKLDISMLSRVSLADIDTMGLQLPDHQIDPTFAEFLDWNADRLQLFDTPAMMQIRYENPTFIICMYEEDLL